METPAHGLMDAALALFLTLVVSPPTVARPPQTLPVRTIPFEYHGDIIYLSVRVNGSRPLRFELDTFAGVDVINRRCAVDIGLPFEEAGVQANAGAGDGATRIAMAQNVQLDISGWPVTAKRFAVLDLDAVAEGQGSGYDGLIGGRQLLPYVVEIDYSTATMKLYDPAVWSYRGTGEVLPMQLYDGYAPMVRASVVVGSSAAIEAEFVFDSPARCTVMFNTPFVRQHDLLAASRGVSTKLLSDEMKGVGGSSKMYTGRISEFRLGSFVLRQPTVDFVEAKAGTLARGDFAGILGSEIFRRFLVIFDFPGRKMILEPTERLGEPFEVDMSGIRWLARAPEFREFQVQSVLDDSPAEEAGVRASDVLVAVDDKPASDFDLRSLRRYLEVPGRNVLLTLRRRQDKIAIRLKLRRMI